MSRKLVATLCLSMASIGDAAAEAAATELGLATDLQAATSAAAGHAMTSIADPAWLVRHAADPGSDPWPEEPQRGGFTTHRPFDLGGLQGGAAAVFDLDGFAAPAHRGDWADLRSEPRAGFNASLGAAAGLQLGEIQAGPYSRLTYTRSVGGGGRAGIGGWDAVDQSVTGSVGLQATTRFDSGLGPMESHLSLSLDHDFLVDRDTVESAVDPWRRNIYIEEVDASEFDFENAIVFLKHRGRVPGWFFYETRLRVRMTGFKAITGRIWIKW